MDYQRKSQTIKHDKALLKKTDTSKLLPSIRSPKIDSINTAEAESRATSEPQQDVTKRKVGSIYPAWNEWSKRNSIKLWELVALSKNINPSKLKKIEVKNPRKYANYCIRLKTARSWIGTGLTILDHPDNGEDAEDKMVSPVEFVQCAQTNKKKVEPKLLEICKVIKERLDNQRKLGRPNKQQSNKINNEDKLQEAANELAKHLASSKKGVITKRSIAKKLHLLPEWSNVSAATIERRILRQW